MEKIFKSKLGCIITAMIVCLFWGSLYSFIKIGQPAFGITDGHIPSIMLFAGLRFVICGIIMVLIDCIGQKKLVLPDRKSFMPIFWVALITIVIHYSFTYIALSIGQSSKAAILKQIGFLLLSCFAFLFRKEDKFSINKLIGGFLGFAGVIAVNINGMGFDFAIGDLLVLIASFCSVAGSIISKNAYDKCNPVTVVAYSQLIGGIVLVVAGLIMGGSLAPTSSGYGILAYMCFASIVAYILWNILVKYNDISFLSVLKFAEPLFAVIVALFMFPETESFKTEYIIAFAFMSLAVVSINLKKKN